MNFYCVYCNQRKNNKKRSNEEKTKEHFIPQSIGGKWTITICSKCNSLAGGTCDNYLAKISWLYKFYDNKKILSTQGIATLKNENKVKVNFKIQGKTKGKKSYHLISCYNSKTNTRIYQKEIQSIKVKLENVKSISKSYPAIFKIALGAAYFLIRKHKKWVLTKSVFQNITLAQLRNSFLGTKNFNPGGIGTSFGPKLQSLSKEECQKLMRNDNQKFSKRKHIISIKGHQGNLEVIVCLFSEFFWKVIIPNTFLIINEIKEETILYNLNEIEIEKAGNMMRINEDIFINIGF